MFHANVEEQTINALQARIAVSQASQQIQEDPGIDRPSGRLPNWPTDFDS
jgi:hypothetical protein